MDPWPGPRARSAAGHRRERRDRTRDQFIILDDDSGYRMVRRRLPGQDRPRHDLWWAAGWAGRADLAGAARRWTLSGRLVPLRGPWRLLEPAAGGCVSEREVTRRIALRDGWLIVGSGATPPKSRSGQPGRGERPGRRRAGRFDAGPAHFAVPAVPTGSLDVDGPCPAGRPSLSDVVALEAYDRAACFGSSDLSFRAWVVDPGEGYGGTCEPLTPRWLYACVLPDWWLAETKTSTTRLDPLERPDAKGDLKGVRQMGRGHRPFRRPGRGDMPARDRVRRGSASPRQPGTSSVAASNSP